MERKKKKFSNHLGVHIGKLSLLDALPTSFSQITAESSLPLFIVSASYNEQKRKWAEQGKLPMRPQWDRKLHPAHKFYHPWWSARRLLWCVTCGNIYPCPIPQHCLFFFAPTLIMAPFTGRPNGLPVLGYGLRLQSTKLQGFADQCNSQM